MRATNEKRDQNPSGIDRGGEREDLREPGRVSVFVRLSGSPGIADPGEAFEQHMVGAAGVEPALVLTATGVCCNLPNVYRMSDVFIDSFGYMLMCKNRDQNWLFYRK